MAFPNASQAPGKGPDPTPSSSLPPLSASRVAASSATRNGSSSGSTSTPVPRPIRLVCWAIAARTTSGAATCSLPWRKCRWMTQPES